MTNTINDHVFQLQWDGSKVTRGIDAVEARLYKLQKGVGSKLSSAQERATSGRITKSRYNAERVLRDKQRNLSAVVKSQFAAENNQLKAKATYEKQQTKKESDSEWQQLKAQADQADHYQKRQAANAKVQIKSEREKNAQLRNLARKRIQEASFETARLRAIGSVSDKQGVFDRLGASASVGKKSKDKESILQSVSSATSHLSGFKGKYGAAGSIKSKDDLARMQQDLIKVNSLTKQLGSHAKTVSKQFSALQNITKRISATFLAMGASTFGAYALVGVTKAAFEASKQYQNMRVQMQAGFGSQKAATEQMAYAEEVAERMGLSINGVAEGWAKIGMSAKANNMPLEQSKKIFEDTSVAIRSFGLDAEDTKGVFRAITQMMSVNRVRAEEFSGQLAERIPGALSLLEKASGLSGEAFTDAYTNGKIALPVLYDFLDLLAKNSKESGAYAASLQTTSAGQERFNNAMKRSGDAFYQSGLDKAVGNVFTKIADKFDENKDLIKGIGGAIAGFVNITIAVLEPLYTLTLKPILWFLGNIYDMFDKISNIDLDDENLSGFLYSLRFLSGTLYDILYGWEDIQAAFDSFTVPKAIEHLGIILEDIKQTMLWVSGQDSKDGEGGTNTGWAKAPAASVVAMAESTRDYYRSQQPAMSQMFQIHVNGNGDDSIKTAVIEALQQTFTFGVSPVTQ